VRGGRGGARGGGRAPPGIPGWDPETNMLVNDQPLDTYPKTYQPPVAPPLSSLDARSVASLVAFRRAFHSLPLYTHRHMAAEVISSASVTDPPPRLYDQSQVNARFGVKSKATLDPFLAVPMYSHQFVDESRTLPDLKSREFAKHLFPDELWNTLDGKDRPAAQNAKIAKLNGRPHGASRRGRADNLEDPFSAWEDDPLSGASRGLGKKHEHETEEQRQKRIREAADGGAVGGGDNEEGDGEGDLDDDEEEMSQEDDDFEDDEDGGDYDAEQYFDDGVDGEMEDEGVGESALDF